MADNGAVGLCGTRGWVVWEKQGEEVPGRWWGYFRPVGRVVRPRGLRPNRNVGNTIAVSHYYCICFEHEGKDSGFMWGIVGGAD